MPEKKLSQTDRLYNLLSDGEPHSTVEILNKIYGVGHSGYANIHGRVTDVRRKYKPIEIINFRDDKIKSLTYYQIKPPREPIDSPKEPEIPLEETPEYAEYHAFDDSHLNHNTNFGQTN